MTEANFEPSAKKSLKAGAVLQHLNHTEIRFSDIQRDFFPDQKTCIFYLSLCSFAAKPQQLSSFFYDNKCERLVLVCYVDTPDINSIEVVNKFCCLNGISLILAWDDEELRRYVETISALIKETGMEVGNNFDFYTMTFSTIAEMPYLNKADISTLINTFPDLLIVLNTSVLGFASVPGISRRKARHITALVQNASS